MAVYVYYIFNYIIGFEYPKPQLNISFDQKPNLLSLEAIYNVRPHWQN